MLESEDLEKMEDRLDLELEDTIEETRAYLSQYWPCLLEQDHAYLDRRAARELKAAQSAGAVLGSRFIELDETYATYAVPEARGDMLLLEGAFSSFVISSSEKGDVPALLATAKLDQVQVHIVARIPGCESSNNAEVIYLLL